MGFKKTTEGRVFFKSSGQAANQGSANDSPVTSAREAGEGAAQTQMQILVLLRSLNEKLKSNKIDRNQMHAELTAYKRLIEDLEDKADRSERAFLDVEQKLATRETQAQATLKELEATRKRLAELEGKANEASSGYVNLKSQLGQNQKISQMVAKKQLEIEHKQNEAEAKLAEAQALIKGTETWRSEFSAKLEDATCEQNKLARKIDKAIEERARFMRKLERIEETVIQTRDSLNAKAMVLLTDQNGEGAEEDHEEPSFDQLQRGPAEIPYPYMEQQNRWSRASKLQGLMVGFFIVGGILTGWLISEMQKPTLDYQLPDVTAWYNDVVNKGSETDGFQPLSKPYQSASKDVPAGLSSEKWQTSDDVSAFAEVPENTAPQDMAFVKDGSAPTPEEQQNLAKAFDTNSNEVGAALNQIKPAVSNVQKALEKPGQAQADQTKIAKASLPKAETPKTSALTIEQSKSSEPAGREKLLSLIQPDQQLPPAIQEIERDAFNGIPEAQHDLAAIYTAGHAGVKQNYDRAAFWFEQAANAGIANARYNLGVLYHQGLGVRSDINKAIKWYRGAADLGHPEAQYNLGIAYIEGIGVNYNPELAARNFESAARQGLMEAAYNLGLIYENGLLGQAKPDEALMWYKMASDQGSPEAKSAMEQLARALGVDLDDVSRIAENMSKLYQSDHLTTGKTARSANSNLDKEQVLMAQIQEYLMRAGLYPGPADGIYGPLTKDAIRSYQSINNLDVTGQASDDLLTHMLANSQSYNGQGTSGLIPQDIGSREQ